MGKVLSMRRYDELTVGERRDAFLIEARVVLNCLKSSDPRDREHLNNILVNAWFRLKQNQLTEDGRKTEMDTVIREIKNEVKWLVESRSYPGFHEFAAERRKHSQAS